MRGRVTQGSWLEAGVSSPQPAGHLPGHQRQQELIMLLLLRGAVLVLCIKEVRDSSVPIGPVVSLGRLEHELERRWRRVVRVGGCRKCLCEPSCETGGERLGRRGERDGGGKGEGEGEGGRRRRRGGGGGERERRPNMQGARAGGISCLYSLASQWLDAGSGIVMQASGHRGSRAQRGQQVCQSQVGQLPSQRGTWFPREAFPKVWAST